MSYSATPSGATSSSRRSRSTPTTVAHFSEATPLAELEDPETEDIWPNYDARKAACEHVLDEIYGDRATHVRAGLIVGPFDPTNRFTYYASRRAAATELLREVAEQKLPALREAIERAEIVRGWLEDAARCCCPTLDHCPLFDDPANLPDRSLVLRKLRPGAR